MTRSINDFSQTAVITLNNQIHSFFSRLTELQKKTVLVAAIAFSALTLLYLIYKYQGKTNSIDPKKTIDPKRPEEENKVEKTKNKVFSKQSKNKDSKHGFENVDDADKKKTEEPELIDEGILFKEQTPTEVQEGLQKQEHLQVQKQLQENKQLEKQEKFQEQRHPEEQKPLEKQEQIEDQRELREQKQSEEHKSLEKLEQLEDEQIEQRKELEEPTIGSEGWYEEMWMRMGNKVEDMPKGFGRQCVMMYENEVKREDIWLQRKKEIITRSEKLEAAFTGISNPGLNQQLKKLIEDSFALCPVRNNRELPSNWFQLIDEISFYINPIFLICHKPIDHPDFETIIFFLSYNVRQDKFGLALSAKLKQRDDAFEVLEYTLTNNANSHSILMKHRISQPDLIAFLSVSSLTKLAKAEDISGQQQSQDDQLKHIVKFKKTKKIPNSLSIVPQDKPLETALSKDNDSAWLLNDGTEYTVTFPDAYDIKPMTFKITR